jgi:hypothetical protein
LKNYERAGTNAPTRHRKVKGYTISNNKTNALASLASCAAVIFTTRVNSIMDCSVASEPWGPKARVNGLWLVVTKVACALPRYRRRLGHLPRGRDSRGAFPAAHLQVFAHDAAQRGDGRGCEGFDAVSRLTNH